MNKYWKKYVGLLLTIVLVASAVNWTAFAGSPEQPTFAAAKNQIEIASVTANESAIVISATQSSNSLELKLVFLKDGGIRLYDSNKNNGMFQNAVDELTDTVTNITNETGMLRAYGATSGSSVVVDYTNTTAWKIEVYGAENSTPVYSIEADELLVTYKETERTNVSLCGEIVSGEQFIGLGERYTGTILNGKTYPIWNVDGWSGGLNGEKLSSYANVPLLHSSNGYSLFFNSYYNANADIGDANESEYRFDFEGEDLDIFLWTGTPLENLKSYMAVTGTTVTIPKWATRYWAGGTSTHYWDKYTEKDENGNIVAYNYDTRLEEVLQGYQDMGTMPSAVYGEGTPMRTLDEVMSVSNQYGVKMFGWNHANAVWAGSDVVEVSAKMLTDYSYFPDATDLPLAKDENGNYLKLLDYTHENVATLLNKVMTTRTDAGLAGLMVDYGEYVPAEGIFANDLLGNEMHNMQAYYYNRAMKNMWDTSAMAEDYILFARAGSAGSQQFAAQFGGDQKCNFEGLRQAVMGGLSASASGFSIWGSDIGGIGTGPNPSYDSDGVDVNPQLTAELYMRWLGFGTFSTLMRAHGTQDHDPWTFEEKVVSEGLNVDVKEVFRKYYWTRENLLDTIYSATLQSNKDGTPPMQLMGLAYPEYFSVDDEYLFCNEILVAPVYTEAAEGAAGSVSRTITLPKGNWYDLWNGTLVKSDGNAFSKTIAVEDTPAYVRSGSVMPIDISSKTYNLADSMDESDKVQALLITPAEEGKSRTFSWYIGDDTNAPEYQYSSATSDTAYSITAEQGNNPTVLRGYGLDSERVFVDGVELNRLYQRPQGNKTGFFVDDTTNEMIVILANGDWSNISFEREIVWDYEFDLERRANIEFLNDAFDVYKFGLLTEGSTITAKVGPKEPTEVDEKSSAGRTYFTTDTGGERSRGYLRPAVLYANRGNTLGCFNTLTYENSTFTDFELEYEVLPGYGHFGVAFGAEAGMFPVSLDGDNSNDTGVLLFTTNGGSLFAGGAIDTDTLSYTGFSDTDDAVYKNPSNSLINKTKNYQAKYILSVSTVETDPTDESPVQTICVRVKDGVMTTWEKTNPNDVVTVNLNDNYQGGYVSLIANENMSGAFKAFRIRALDTDICYEYDFVNTDVEELDNIFNGYYMTSTYGAHPYQVTADKPSNQWIKSSGLKPNYAVPTDWQKARDQLTYLTFQKSSVYDFEAKIRLLNNATEYGVAIAPAGNVFVDKGGTYGIGTYVSSDGKIRLIGGIDVDTVSVEGGLTSTASTYQDQPFVSSTAVPGFKTAHPADSKTAYYTLCVSHLDGIFTVYIEEFPEQKISVQTTDVYQGGYLSLYSTGNNTGGFYGMELNTYADDTIYLERGNYGGKVSFTVRTDVPYTNLCLKAEYDNTVYGYASAVCADGTTADVRNSGDGSLKIYLKAADRSLHVGEWVTLVFTQIEGMQDTSGLNVRAARTADSSGHARLSDVYQTFPGDVNNDNILDVRDLVRLKRYQAQQTATSYNFDKVDVSTLTDFTSTKFDMDNSYAVVGEADQAVSAHWFSGNTTHYTSSWNERNIGLKPQTKEIDRVQYYLNYKTGYQDFEASTEIYWGTYTGIAFGKKNVFASSKENPGVRIYFLGGRLQLVGALDFNTAQVSGTQASKEIYNDEMVLFYFTSSEKVQGSFSVTQQLILNVKVEGDMLTVWVDGYDAVLTVSLAEHCEKGTVSLVARKYDGDGGGIKSFTIQGKSKISEINSKLNINTAILTNDNFALLRKRLIRY